MFIFKVTIVTLVEKANEIKYLRKVTFGRRKFSFLLSFVRKSFEIKYKMVTLMALSMPLEAATACY